MGLIEPHKILRVTLLVTLLVILPVTQHINSILGMVMLLQVMDTHLKQEPLWLPLLNRKYRQDRRGIHLKEQTNLALHQCHNRHLRA